MLVRQIGTLVHKNITIALFRHPFSTLLRAFVLPVLYILVIVLVRSFVSSPSVYGIGVSTPVRSLLEGWNAATTNRNLLAFVNNGFTGGDIEAVINAVAAPLTTSGEMVHVLATEDELKTLCKSTWRAVSHCYGAVSFHSSPTEGPGDIWNYTILVDGALGGTINVRRNINEVEVYPIPIQHAVDFAIASLNTTNQPTLPSSVNEYPFTALTLQQRLDQTRIQFVGTITKALAVVFFVGMVGIIYQLTGFMATEREIGMSQLIEAMMPNRSRWQPKVARFASYYIAFSIFYVPAWVIMGLVMRKGLFTQTPIGVMIIFQLLQGLAMASFAILGASFFRKSQVSGITVSVVAALMAIVAQILAKKPSSAVAILSLLFAPSNYVYFIIYISRFEINSTVVSLSKSAPGNPWGISGSLLLIFTIIQIVVYPILGFLVERWLYSTASSARILTNEDAAEAVKVQNLQKIYSQGWLVLKVLRLCGRAVHEVLAVDDLSFTARKGEVVMLLGSNGSGKSTTMDAIVGLHTMTGGSIRVDGQSGLGYCPQKNVFWDLVTVEEHIKIFNKLKTTGERATPEETKALIKEIGLEDKTKAKAKTLSGGQMRKLQLAMMFTGGSSVCCVDEISSGLDPLSRRKVWDIILKERGARTIIMSTHFLDEADALADKIIILSKGSKKVEGSSVALKNAYGGGYRVLLRTAGMQSTPQIEDSVLMDVNNEMITYTVPGSAEVARLVVALEKQGFYEYEVSGPTMENVFLKMAGEDDSEDPSESEATYSSTPEPVDHPEKNPGGIMESAVVEVHPGISLMTGRPTGFFEQTWILFCKRWTVLRQNFLPFAAAFLIPIIAGGLVTRFLHASLGKTCSAATYSVTDLQTTVNTSLFDIVAGPSSRLTPSVLLNAFQSLDNSGSAASPSDASALLRNVHLVDTLDEFNNYINANFSHVLPGGFFLGEVGSDPTFAYLATSLRSSIFIQNVMDSLITNVSLATHYSTFAIPATTGLGDSMQLVTYFCLALCAFPAFFALYPTLERARSIRALEYSNGVKPLRLWTAYLLFDWSICLASSVIITVIFVTSSSAWYHVGYLFPVLVLYGLASTLLSYAISLFSSSQLAAFAFSAGGQAVMYLVYIVTYFSILTFSPIDAIDFTLRTANFVISALSPVANVARALWIAVNVLSSICDSDGTIITNAGKITLFSGPIIILLLQSVFLFLLVLWWDAGSIWPVRFLNLEPKPTDLEATDCAEPEVQAEAARIENQDTGLKVWHVTKSFQRKTAVQNLTFGVVKGEMFALLGPNGAGKTTTTAVIRGDVKPSSRGGEAFVENSSTVRNRTAARSHLGVCPQYNALDQMTVSEQLRFYAKIRGVSDIEHNVRQVIHAVDLQQYASCLCAKLSGGNKRKLSLGISLMGNPSVLLLDEPSSGMDAVAKRKIWKSIKSISSDRAVLITSHSMEEVAALASRAGIMDRRMLVLGTPDELRRKNGDRYYIHLVTLTAPHTPQEEMERIRQWIAQRLPDATFELNTFHGQIRFSISAAMLASSPTSDEKCGDGDEQIVQHKPTLASLFMFLEGSKEEFGLAYYSISQTTLDEVFLNVVGKHQMESSE